MGWWLDVSWASAFRLTSEFLMGKRGRGHSVKPSETVLKAGAGREVSKSSKCIPVSVKVAQLRETGYDNFETWLKDPKNLYVGRRGRIFIHANGSKRIFHYAASKWQNPFVVSKNLSREMACEKFRAALLNGSLKDHEDTLEHLWHCYALVDKNRFMLLDFGIDHCIAICNVLHDIVLEFLFNLLLEWCRVGLTAFVFPQQSKAADWWLMTSWGLKKAAFLNDLSFIPSW